MEETATLSRWEASGEYFHTIFLVIFSIFDVVVFGSRLMRRHSSLTTVLSPSKRQRKAFGLWRWVGRLIEGSNGGIKLIFQIKYVKYSKYPNIPDKVRVGTGRRPIRMSGETMHCLYSSQHLQLFYPPPKRSISNWLIFCFFSCVPRKVILIVVSKILNVTQHVYIVLFSSSCDEIERCLQCQKLAGGLILW